MTHPIQDRTARPGPGRPSDLQGLLAAARALHDSAVRDGRAGGPAESCGLACAVITGDPAAFSTAQGPFLDRVDLPGPDTGWRSRTDIRNGLGQRIALELVSRASGRGAAAAAAAGTGPHRAEALLAIGEADRRLAAAARDARTVRSLARGPTDPDGATDLLGLSLLLDEVEQALAPDAPRRVRRLHGFPAPGAGGPCDLAVQVWPAETRRFRTTSLRSLLRHADTGAILAIAETLRAT